MKGGRSRKRGEEQEPSEMEDKLRKQQAGEDAFQTGPFRSYWETSAPTGLKGRRSWERGSRMITTTPGSKRKPGRWFFCKPIH